MECIEIKNLTYKYPTSENNILNGITLSVKKGELCAIAGANGSGKTTLCSVIRGFIPHFYKGELSGEVLINGRNIQNVDMGDLALEIGFVFQNPFTQISGVASTVYDELVFGLENMGVPASDIPRRVEEAMELTKIQDFRYKDPYQLSGGQQQRVALAAILVMGQDILVIDEPTSQLDPQSTDDVFESICMMKKMGKTIILVEHKMEQIAEYADHVVVLSKGKIVMEGIPEKVFADPLCGVYHTRLPQSTKIVFELLKEGIEFPEIPVTVEKSIDTIKKVMAKA